MIQQKVAMDAKEDSQSSRTLASFCWKTEPGGMIQQKVAMNAKEDSQSSHTLASFCSKKAPPPKSASGNDLTEGRDGREGR